MKKLLFLVVLICFNLSGWAQFCFNLNDIVYTITGTNTVEVRNGGKYTGSITIPSSIIISSVTYSVTSIGNNAFNYCTSLTSVTLPPSVTKIGYLAFANCTSLTTVNIPPSVTTIDSDAFYCSTSLTSVTIPSSVTTIRNSAFKGCSALINVDSNNPNFSSRDGVFYNRNQTELLHCPISINGAFTIPPSVTTIDKFAFYNCTSLTSVTIPLSVTTIRNSAFYNCTSLTSVTIPSSVTTIGVGNFSLCSTIINVDSNNPNYSSKDGLFYDKNQTTLIQCPISINGAFTIPSSVTTIANAAFWGCTSLTSVTIPSSVTTIESFAFNECTSLTSVTIPSSITTIANYVFFGCTSLSTIYSYLSTPMSLTYDQLYDIRLLTCKLYVPIGTKSLYQAAIGWKNFINIVEFDPTGVNNIHTSNMLIYPNPTSSVINIKFGNNNELQTLKIFNSIGRKVYDSKVLDNQSQIDVSGYSSGQYFLLGEDKYGQTLRQGRFIKE